MEGGRSEREEGSCYEQRVLLPTPGTPPGLRKHHQSLSHARESADTRSMGISQPLSTALSRAEKEGTFWGEEEIARMTF